MTVGIFLKKQTFWWLTLLWAKVYFWIDLHLLFLGRRGTPFFSHGRSIVKKKDIFLSFQVQKGNKNKSISRIFALVIQKIKYLASRISSPFQTPPRKTWKWKWKRLQNKTVCRYNNTNVKINSLLKNLIHTGE